MTRTIPTPELIAETLDYARATVKAADQDDTAGSVLLERVLLALDAQLAEWIDRAKHEHDAHLDTTERAERAEAIAAASRAAMQEALDAQRAGKWALVDSILQSAIKSAPPALQERLR